MDFKPGQNVKVNLSRKMTLDGETFPHPAKFVRYHQSENGQPTGWAEVELEKPHSAHKLDPGVVVRQLMVPVSVLSALLLLFLLAIPAQAQHLGDVQLSTANQTFGTIASPQTCTGSAQTFTLNNVGQSGHLASAQSSATSFVMEIDGSDGTSVPYKISGNQVSFANSGSTSYLVAANGYFPKFTITVTCTATATFALSYSGYATPISLSVGPSGGTTISVGGVANQVQGVVGQEQSGGAVNPVVGGALQPPINQNFLSVGIDNASVSGLAMTANRGGTFTVGTAPTPTQTGELALAFETPLADNTSTQTVTPWQCASGVNCTAAGNNPPTLEFLSNIGTGQILQRTWTGGPVVSGESLAAFVLVDGSSVAIRQTTQVSSNSPAFSSNTLAGSLLLVGIKCIGTTPCSVSGITDTQGNTWKQLTAVYAPFGQQVAGLLVWGSTNTSSAAADTLTITVASGTAGQSTLVEVQNPSPSSLTSPAISAQADQLGNLIVRQDAQGANLLTCSVTLSTNTTTQLAGCAAPTTINNVPVRIYITDIQINTTIAGTSTTIQLKTGTGTNCGTGTANLSAIAYPNTTVGIQSFMGVRTPLLAPLQSAVCATQAGTTPGTTVVEVRGFLAP